MMLERKKRRVEPLPLQPRRDFFPTNPKPSSEVVNSIFKELVNQILEKLKHDPHFRWSSKMNGDALWRNQSM